MKQEQYKKLKRAFDVAASVAGLTIASPVLLIASVAVKLESRGPIVYSSPRVGEGYKVFGLLKFRTMYTNADKQTDLMKTLNQYQSEGINVNELEECPFCKILQRKCSTELISDIETICENLFLLRKDKSKNATFFKIKNDPRVTRIGKFLRKTSIDELPQLFNILKGDMSLIGNRPLPLYEAEQLTSDHAIDRFNAPSGLTGLWQVTKRGKESVSETARIELDKTYAKEWSLKTDLKILLKTFPALLQEENV
jgi:lipopolysaccharide/colanic/teichoic acid biosynthesis glycosyltransferase